MADVGIFPLAADLGGIGLNDADVVEHGPPHEEVAVDGEVGIEVGDEQGQFGNLHHMSVKEKMSLGALLVVFVDHVLNVLRDVKRRFYHLPAGAQCVC